MNIFFDSDKNKPGRTAVYSDCFAIYNFKTEVLHSLLSIPTHTWVVANKDKVSNERQLLEYSTFLQ